MVFGQNLPKKESSSGNKCCHWILHIRISLGSKFQLKLIILTFWTKTGISSQKWKERTSLSSSAYSNYSTIVWKIYLEFTRFHRKSWFEVKVERCFLAIFSKITIKFNFLREDWGLDCSLSFSFFRTRIPQFPKILSLQS